MPQSLTTSAAIELGVAADEVFAATVGMDVPAIVRAHGPLPGVEKVDGQTGPWTAVGQQRRLTLTDGAAATETLTFLGNRRFAYRIDFDGPFKSLVDYGEGHFTVIDEGALTVLAWRYVFAPTSWLTFPIVALIAKLLWPGYMRAALARLKAEIENQS